MVEIFDDIRKLYQFKLPCEELKNHIEFFAETCLEATHQHITAEQFTVKLFPSYTPTIWINFGPAYHLKNGEKWHTISHNTDILLLRNEIVERRNRPSDNVLTVKFNPGGFEAIFGISQTRIASGIIHINEIIPDTVTRKVKRRQSFTDRVTLLQNYFLGALKKTSRKDYHLQYVLNGIESFCSSGMEYGTAKIASKLCITEKTFCRYFHSVVGTNPKHYLGIVRARTALTAYVRNRQDFLPYDYGYYDMSHFYRDAVKFTGQKITGNRF
ncbi:MAG TPA: helix-turn-helix domain-containing protein [Chitinophagaceae bacterium]|nr:helix-turn-helix domain-containing protein [Chitinophagaceae bacterium]